MHYKICTWFDYYHVACSSENICNNYTCFIFPADPEGPGCCALLLALVSILLIIATLPFSLCLCIKVSTAFLITNMIRSFDVKLFMFKFKVSYSNPYLKGMQQTHRDILLSYKNLIMANLIWDN